MICLGLLPETYPWHPAPVLLCKLEAHISTLKMS